MFKPELNVKFARTPKQSASDEPAVERDWAKITEVANDIVKSQSTHLAVVLVGSYAAKKAIDTLSEVIINTTSR